MRKFRVVVFLLFFQLFPIGYLLAQQTEYRMQSEGIVPEKLLNHSNFNRSNYKDKAIFANAFLIYGTDLNQYLDRFLSHLLSDEDHLRQHVRIYILRSIEPNIYTTSDSIIIINIGLLAQIQNESELAFILSHELSHIYKHHSYTFDQFSNKEKNRQPDLFNKDHCRYDEDEIEADQFGYTHYFLPHGYKTEDIQNIFLCFEPNRIFEKKPFDFKDFILQQSYSFTGQKFLNPKDIELDHIPDLPDLTQKRIDQFKVYKRQNLYEAPNDQIFLNIKELLLMNY